ncbi:tyrosine-type recombinase/integrase [Pseudomonas syringae pv. actinidiae]|uniref:Integrase n=4 Tax=Pseudomonas syringae TaxID=317 RepID=A0AAN4Q2H9_PSESF|nr:integrase arm-type DNA-binding domain-containing protein [Pseudomonas syringae]EPN65896.1 integrase family protein [Pseudomonas syringae pv. actinidiae ICMP 19101]AKT29256.1 integrase [Pseudomonas syringae pv. actinidiae ICMP 18884]AOE55750.1 integrase [Pseudomonas syringae pv. actinidiae ICMP 18708]APP96609.1 integrase [Pseudomonas syringae pv. actinidiae]APQ02464.1 integrase [Pseudomonas syringae pv. actinidiae]
MALTDTALRTAKPRDKLYRLADAQGLCIEVTPSGGKLWRLRYRFDGKAKMLSLGIYPAITLAQARERREAARRMLAQGVDPSAHKQQEKTAAAAQVLTMELLAREWYDYNRPRWAPATSSKVLQYLESDIFPVIGRQPASEVQRPELVELVRKIEKREAFNVARKVRQWLSQIFRFGLAKGVVPGNPATDLDVVAAHAPRTRHHPHVSEGELPELLERLETAQCDITSKIAIRLLALTAVRPGELRLAPWSEFDLDAATWTIPAARMKARRPHIVPLPRQAVALLRALHELTGTYPLAFPGRNNRARPMSENTVNKALSTMGYEGRQTGHGFRHLLSTSLNSRGYNRDWIERQLAHGDQDSIRDTYNHANYLEQRRGMMQAWADSIDALCAGANVVSIKRKA